MKAFELMKQAADLGSADALSAVGFFYATGTAVEKDDAEAVEWFKKGAEKGSAKAQLNLGQMLASGKGVAKDVPAGLKWIRIAAEQGLPEALYAQGEVFLMGKYGLSKDPALASPPILKSAEAGLAVAQNAAGVMYREGSGVIKNLDEAQAWFRKAAEQDHGKAQSSLAHLLGVDKGDNPKRVEALKWLLLAAGKNEVTATKTLEEIQPGISAELMAEAENWAAEERERLTKADRER